MALNRKVLALSAAAVTAAALFVFLYLYQTRPALPAWTYAFYLDGSGSLLLEQQRNLKEIIQGAQTLRDANIIVYLDRGPKPGAPMFYGWEGARVFQVKGAYKDVLKHPLSPELPQSVEKPRFTRLLLKGLNADEQRLFQRYYPMRQDRYVLNKNSLKPEDRQTMLAALQKNGYLFGPARPADSIRAENISRFFSLARDNYPARHYAFFMAGHGLGWFSGRGAQSMTTASAGPRPDRNFYAGIISQGLHYNAPDILCLDLCLMGDLESLHALRRSASFLILGQGPLPSGGQDYRYLLEQIKDGHAARPDAMAHTVFASTAHALDKSRLNSAVSLIKTGPAIDRFVSGFTAMITDKSMREQIIQIPDERLARLHDWGGLAHEMINVRELIKTVEARSGRRGPDASAFILETHSTSANATGLSIYYPYDRRHYLRLRDAYAALDFTKATQSRWLELLDRKHGQLHN